MVIFPGVQVQSRRLKRLVVDAESLVAEWLRMDGQNRIACVGMPKTVKVVGLSVTSDLGLQHKFDILLESEDFPEVLHGHAIPELQVRFSYRHVEGDDLQIC